MLRYYILAVPQLAAQILLTQSLYWLLHIPEGATSLRTLIYALVMGVLYVTSFVIQQRWVFSGKPSNDNK